MWSQLSFAALTGLSLGLMSSAHCTAMCGPIAAAAGARRGHAFVLGRIASYSLCGALAGTIGRALLTLGPTKWIEAGLSWSFAIVLLTSALKLLRSNAGAPLMQVGTKPRRSFIGGLLAHAAREPFLLGLLMALLPCGALYAAAMAAAATGNALPGGVSMAMFAAITSAPLLGAAKLGQFLASAPGRRPALGALLLVGAGVLVLRPLPSLFADDALPSCHRLAHVEGG